MEEQRTNVVEEQKKFWLSLMVIGVVWFGWGIGACFCTGISPLLIILSHISFCIYFIFTAFFSYKTLLFLIKIDEKEKEFNRKEKLEKSQRENYDKSKMKIVEDFNLEERIKTVCEGILSKQESTYRDNLKTLKSNMELFNEVKKIIDGQ
jgi:hypothetical protein